MRRLALIAGLLALAGAVLTLVLGASAQGSSSASFDVIFDDARGLVGGQLVKVAGAKAGTINNVVVTQDAQGDFQAKVEGSIDSKFMPFRQDATCTIRPEGLIAENYVDCDPGTPGSPILQGNPPTVPVSHTTEPVSLLDLFNIFNLPTRERFEVIIDELGIGTAGRGADFNDIIRRANPALALARQAIGILSRQKAQLASLVDATSTIASQGASHTVDVQNFINRAASLTTLTAAHSNSLSQTINRLPGLLDAAQPALQETDIVARDGTPLLQEIHAAVPSLNRVATDLPPFAKAATPALATVSNAIKSAIPAIRATTPLIKTLRAYLVRSLPETQLFAKLLVNLQQKGFPEAFASLFYYIGGALARHDAISHLLSVLLIGPQNGLCGVYTAKPTAGCEAHFAPQAGSSASITSANATQSNADGTATPASTATGGTGSAPSGSTTSAGGTPADTGTGTTSPPAAGLPGAATTAVNKTGQALQNLISFLTK